MQLVILSLAVLFFVHLTPPASAELSSRYSNSVAYRLQQSSVSKNEGGYEVTLPSSVDRFYVKDGDKFHAMRRTENGEWMVNRAWTLGERQARMIQESGRFIDLADSAARRIVLNIDGRRTVLSGDGSRWREEGGTGSGSSGYSSSGSADQDDQDTTPVNGSDHANSVPLCQLTGSCGGSSHGSSSGSGSATGGTTGGSTEDTGPMSRNCSGGSTGSVSQDNSVVQNQTFRGTVNITGNNVKFRCNKVTGGTPGIEINGKNVEVAFNDISSIGGGIYLGSRNATDAVIAYNHIHNATEKHPGIYVGTGRGTHETKLNASVHHNLITNWSSHNCIELKSSHNTVAFNTLIGGGTSCTINNRHGWDNSFIANWVEGGGINASDFRTRVIGNVLRNSGSGFGTGLLAKAGNVHPENYADRPGQYVTAKDTLFAGNDTDKFILGWESNSTNVLPARDITIEAHKGAAPQYKRVQGVTIRPTTSVEIPQAKKLTPADVGP